MDKLYFLSGSLKDATAELVGEEITVGRAADNAICLEDETVSAHHAVILRQDGDCIVKDLDSHNGTFVQGRRATLSAMEDGDTVVFGTVEARFETTEVRTAKVPALPPVPAKRTPRQKQHMAQSPFQSISAGSGAEVDRHDRDTGQPAMPEDRRRRNKTLLIGSALALAYCAYSIIRFFIFYLPRIDLSINQAFLFSYLSGSAILAASGILGLRLWVTGTGRQPVIWINVVQMVWVLGFQLWNLSNAWKRDEDSILEYIAKALPYFVCGMGIPVMCLIGANMLRASSRRFKSSPDRIFRTQADGRCPVCGDGKHMDRPRALYDHSVCRKCHNSFAGRRQFAYVIDLILGKFALIPAMAVVYFLVLLLGAAMAHNERETVGEQFARVAFVFSLINGLICGLIFACKDCFRGYSPGKWLCGVRVIDESTGKPGGIVSSFKRNLPLAIIPVVPLVVGSSIMLSIGLKGGMALVGAEAFQAVSAFIIALIVSRQLYKGYRMGDDWSNAKVIWVKHATSPVFAAGGVQVEETPLR